MAGGKASTPATTRTPTKRAPEALSTLIDRIVLTEEIGRLPQPRGAILQLAFWEGRSYPQIAEQPDLPIGTVKSHARRALLHLRTRLAEVTRSPTWILIASRPRTRHRRSADR
jgi:DNA-directed RNA polymerase specialized sigma24 family protein